MKPFTSLFAFVTLTSASAIAAAPLVAQERTRAQSCATPLAQAQAKPAEQATPPLPPPSPRPSASPTAPVGMGRNVQIELTVKLDGPGPVITKQMTLVGVEDLVAMGRSNMEIPVTMGSGNQYRSVGLNVDARPRIFDSTRISLSLKLEFSAVLKPEGAQTAPGAPSFGSAKTELNLALDSGKPLVISRAADAEIGRGFTVELKATILR
jgi:hypothetical protein